MPSGRRKPECPPLIPSGFQTFTREQLLDFCVTSHPTRDSQTRQRVMDGVLVVLQRLEAAGIPADVWIDGSFLTFEQNPSDADIVIVVSAQLLCTASPAINDTIQWLGSEQRRSDILVDCFVSPYFPAESPMRPVSDGRLAYYKQEFGTACDDVSPKGIAVVKVLGGVR